MALPHSSFEPDALPPMELGLGAAAALSWTASASIRALKDRADAIAAQRKD